MKYSCHSIKKTLLVIAILMVSFGKTIKAQDSPSKVGEFDFAQYEKLEDRIYFINEIQNNGFIVKEGEKDGILDIYQAKGCLALEEQETDRLFGVIGQLKQEWQSSFASPMLKTERTIYCINNKSKIDENILSVINAQYSNGIKTVLNNTCESALPFCTDNGAYHFQPNVFAGSPCGGTFESLCDAPYSGCNSFTPTHTHSGFTYNGLSTAPNPAFFYLRIDESGDFDIFMEGWTNQNESIDLDFACWGPFYSIEDICNLSCNNMVDVSYHWTNSEHCYIDNAQTGQYYMLLITNYGNQEGEFYFTNLGTGTTDERVMFYATNNSPICAHENLYLSSSYIAGSVTYLWRGPDGWTSTEKNPTLPNAEPNMSGTYTCIITRDDLTDTLTTEVSVLESPIANFTMSAPIICENEVLTLTNTSSLVNNTLEWLWDFGDGHTDSALNTTHAYTNSGNYTITLSVSNHSCTNSYSQIITIEDQVLTNIYETACDSFTWTGYTGLTYTTDGTYTYTQTSDTSCDKVTELHLTINHADDVTLEPVTTCDSYEWHGTSYTNSDVLTYETFDANGCTYSETLSLTINHADDVTLEPVATCDSYEFDGVTYTESQVITTERTDANGCTYTETFNLTINHAEDVTIEGNTEIVAGEETTLSASEGASYEWSNGETTQSITVAPAVTTTYTVTVTDANGCVATAEIVVSVDDGIGENAPVVNVYPNPTKHVVNVEADGITNIRVVDMLGQTLYETNASSNRVQIDLSGYAVGQYFLEVRTQNGIAIEKIVKR